ncbi:hypothetical protein QMT40_000948 [Parvibaculaceae bacterium PLY_AMNH_Bact1]|nr:hypothetical protein QMT40_000948 [Parvibaculaceae bacterium PLY_AMNH_Bact1]
MSASKRSMPASRASDGFATLTADMMERRGATPPPLVDTRSEAEKAPDGVHASRDQSAADSNPQFGKRAKPTRAPTRTKRTGHATQSVRESGTPSAAHPCQTTDYSDQKVYAGPERRKRDVSPLVERRRSVPPRIKVSVRLEQHRHQRLKGAGVLLGRTHQDIVTVALDQYLDDLGILK